jgi:hypothetical protein
MTTATTPERPASLLFGRFAGKPLATRDDSYLLWAVAALRPGTSGRPEAAAKK